ncbi:MAG: Ig-like domain repeat protein, partial [Methanobrevibacter sp.]|nr:Ig-like domain repeat protein [Methanobrevibacter sp.]
WAIPKLANGSSYIIELVVRVISNGTFSNVAVANSTENKTDVPSNTSNVTVKPVVNLTVVKTSNVTQNLHVGDLVNFTITVTNHGPSNATNVEIVDELDNAFGLISAPGNKTITNNKITWIVPKLDNSSSASVWVVVKLLLNGTFTNAAVVNSTENATTSTNKTNVDVAPKVILNITKEVNATKVSVGDLVRFTITVKNTGLSNATNVIVTDTLDSTFYFNSTDCAEYCTRDGQKITWTIPKLANGTSKVIELVVKVINNGTFSNVASVNSTENTTNVPSNIANVTVGPKVNLTVVKTANVTQNLHVGDLVNFTITVTNHGPSNATNVEIVDELNNSFGFISAHGNKRQVNAKVTWTIPKIANGNSASVWIVVRILANGTLSNVAAVNSTENATAKNGTNITVKPQVSLNITKTANATKISVGDLVKFIITVKNNGLSNATNVIVTDTLHPAFKFNSTNYSQYYSVDGQKITWTVPRLENGTSTVIELVVKVINNGTFSNVASVNSTENTTDVPSNPSEVTVEPKVNLTITKRLDLNGNDEINVGESIRFIITVKNSGPSNATGVAVTDVLSNAFEFESSNETYKRTGQKVTWSIGNLEPGSTIEIGLVVKTVLSGFYSNVAVVNSTESENKTSNRTDVVVLPTVNITMVKKSNITGNASINDLVNFTITVTNNGPSRATGVNVTDILPVGMEYVTSNGRNISSNRVVWNIESMDKNANVTVWVVVRMFSSGSLKNTAHVNSTENVTGTTAECDVNVTPAVDLSIFKKVSKTNATVGDMIAYLITVKNRGNSTATGVVVSEIMKGKFTIMNVTPGKGSYDRENDEWHVGNLSVDEHRTLVITVYLTAEGTVENSVVVTSNEKDLNLTNNNCTADNVTVNRKNTPISLESENITYEDDETIVITLPGDATGKVNVTVGNTTYPDLPIENGIVELVVENPAGGLYNVTVQYGGDNKYLPNSTKGAFKVSPKTPHIRIEVVDIYWGEIEILNVTVDAPGFVNITVDRVGMITVPLNHSIQSRDVLMASKFTPYDGRATWNLIHLAVADYPALAVYLGNENYTSVSTSDIFKVMPLKSQVNITARDIYVGEDAVIDVSLNHNITGNVTVEIDGVKYPLNITDGKGQLIVSGLSAGLKHATVRYDGNETYAPSDNTTTFTVKKHKPPIDVDSYDIYVDEDETITVRLPNDATGTVTITVAGRKYTSQVSDGVATFDVAGLKAGRYTVTASYSGDEKYLSAKADDSFRVLKIKPDIEVTSPDIDVGDDGVITVRLPGDATGRVTIEIDGKKYTADVKNGKAVFTIPDLDAGSYNILVWYSGDEKYLPAETAGSMEVHGHEDTYDIHESNLESHRTANPVIALLAVLILAGACQLRRFKK